jgi:hypothetical protein
LPRYPKNEPPKVIQREVMVKTVKLWGAGDGKLGECVKRECTRNDERERDVIDNQSNMKKRGLR